MYIIIIIIIIISLCLLKYCCSFSPESLFILPFLPCPNVGGILLCGRYNFDAFIYTENKISGFKISKRVAHILYSPTKYNNQTL